MRKMAYVLAVLIVISLFVPKISIAGTFETGDKGTFDYPYQDEYFVVWSTLTNGAKHGNMNGKITPKTKVNILNNGFSKVPLKLLSGKSVLAYGKFVVEGESMVHTYTELNIFVLP